MKHPAIVFCALVPGFSLAASQSHEAAPMMAPAQKPLTDSDLQNERSAPQRLESEEAILDRFHAAFDGNTPRVAVFWNRAFDDQVSDWRSSTRGVVSARGSLQRSGRQRRPAGAKPDRCAGRVPLEPNDWPGKPRL